MLFNFKCITCDNITRSSFLFHSCSLVLQTWGRWRLKDRPFTCHTGLGFLKGIQACLSGSFSLSLSQPGLYPPQPFCLFLVCCTFQHSTHTFSLIHALLTLVISYLHTLLVNIYVNQNGLNKSFSCICVLRPLFLPALNQLLT